MSDLWEHKVGMSLPSLLFPFLSSPFPFLLLPVASPPPLLFGGRDRVLLPEPPQCAYRQHGGVQQEITFRQRLGGILGHGRDRG